MLTKLRIAIAIGLCSFSLACAAQTTITVDPLGPYPTIQKGVNAANAGDTVLVDPGIYQENITITLPITLISAACQPVTAGCNSQTTIDGGDNGSTITVSNISSMKTVIEGFTIINGFNNSYAASSAGIDLEAAGAQVIDNSFSANAAIVAVNNGAVTFSNNTASTATQKGTVCSGDNGLLLAGTNITVLDGTGAIASTTINNNIIGGGKCIGGVGINDAQGTNTYIYGNQISGQAQGIYVASTNALTYIYDNLITGNSSGGVAISHLTNIPGPGVPDTFLLNNTIANNLSGAKGLTGNAGPAEVAISGTFSRVEVVDNILYTNSKTNPVLDCAGAAPTGNNSITPIVLDHNILYNAASNGAIATNGCGPLPALYQNLSGAYDLNLDLDPSFSSSASYQLASGSPAIDSGNNSFATVVPFVTDFAGNTRVQATLLTVPVVDIGAYESAGSAQIGYTYTAISATPSTYYLQSGNTVTISAQLDFGAGPTYSHLSNQPVTFTGIGPNSQIVSPATVNTDANGNASASFVLANYGMYAFESNYVGPGYQAAHSIPVWVYVASPLAVTTIGLTSNINPSLAGQNVTFTVTSSATDGTHPSPVVLADNGTTLATLAIPASGTITYSTATLAQGTHPMTATFAGDSAHTSGVASLMQLVGTYTPTTTTLTSSANPSVFGQSVTITAHVASASGVPTGSVVFLDGATQLGAAVAVTAGVATYTFTAFTVGSHNITVNFTAGGTYANSSGTLTQMVNGDPTQAVLTVTPPATATYGTSVTLSAQVSVVTPYTGTPTGSVTFLDGTAVIGTTALTGGIATFTSGTFSVGTRAFGCTYSGGGNVAGSTCNVVSTAITQATTATTVSSSSNPVYAYAPLTFTVKSTSGGQPLASANITLTITPTGGTATSYPLTTDATGTASYAFTGLPAGTYLVAATYPATTNYSASTNSLTQIVTVDATTTTLVATPNPGIQNNPVTLGASVSESGGLTGPTGSVTFLDGTTPLGAGAFSPTPGAASEFVLTTSMLIPGVHTITANYTPSDPSFSASSATISLTINPQDFTFTATPPSISIQTEHHGALSLSLTAIGGFPGAISISCGTLPQYITCELNPTTVTLNSNGTASTANLTLDTDALLNFAQSHPAPGSGRPAWQAVFAGLLPLLLFGFGATRRRLPRALLPLLLLAAASLSLTACSGKYPGHTPPGTYTIPVTATGTAPGSTGPTTHTLNITLTVTP